MARWYARLQDYDYKIKHVQGKVNSAADALLRPDNIDKDQHSEKQVMIKLEAFINRLTLAQHNTLHLIQQSQKEYKSPMKEWEEEYHITKVKD